MGSTIVFTFAREQQYSKKRGDFDYLTDTGVVLRKCGERQQADESFDKNDKSFLDLYKEVVLNLKDKFNGQELADLLANESLKELLSHRKCGERQQADESFDKSFLDPYREVVRNLKDKFNGQGLADLLATESLKELLSQSKHRFAAAFPADISTLAMFLRWKSFFHKKREEVDVEQLASEIPDFVSAVGFEATVAAVWLFGCFAGYERIAPAVYAANSVIYAWYSGPKRDIGKTKRPAAQDSKELAVEQNESGSVAAKADVTPGEASPAEPDSTSRPGDDDPGTSPSDERRQVEKRGETVSPVGDASGLQESSQTETSGSSQAGQQDDNSGNPNRSQDTEQKNKSRRKSEDCRSVQTNLLLDEQKSEGDNGSRNKGDTNQ